MPNDQDAQEKRAADLWEQLKAETELTPDQQNATEEQRQNWHHQETDPAQVHGNAFTATEQNEKEAQQTDLNNLAMPEMTEQDKQAFQEVLSQEQQALEQEIEITVDPEIEH